MAIGLKLYMAKKRTALSQAFQKKKEPNIVRQLDDIFIQESTGASATNRLAASGRESMPSSSSGIEPIKESHAKVIAFFRASFDIRHQSRLDAQKLFEETGRIQGPEPLGSPSRLYLENRDGKIAWIAQVGKTNYSRGTGLAAEGVSTQLNALIGDESMLAPCYGSDLAEVSDLSGLLGKAKSLIDDMDSYRRLSSQAIMIKKELGDAGLRNPTIEEFVLHLAQSIEMKLLRDGEVLFPVDFQVITPGLLQAGGGHRTVMYVKRTADNLYDVHLFETDGKIGMRFSLDEVARLSRRYDDYWSCMLYSPEDLVSSVISQEKEKNKTLRFSEFKFSDVTAPMFDAEFIKSILARVAVRKDNQGGDNGAITLGEVAQDMLNDIFISIEELGKKKIIPKQILQFSQAGGECEHASILAFMSFYLGRNYRKLPASVFQFINEKGISLANELISEIQAEILSEQLVIKEFKSKPLFRLYDALSHVYVRAGEANADKVKEIEIRVAGKKKDIGTLSTAIKSLRSANEQLSFW